jgi:hypothetical protein
MRAQEKKKVESLTKLIDGYLTNNLFKEGSFFIFSG